MSRCTAQVLRMRRNEHSGGVASLFEWLRRSAQPRYSMCKIHASVRGREEMRSALSKEAASLKAKGPLHVQLPQDAPGKTNKTRN